MGEISIGAALGQMMQGLEIVPGEGAYKQGPECAVCGDWGRVQGNFPFGHELFGKVFPCPAKCRAYYELLEARIARTLEQMGIPESHKDFTFTSFDALEDSYLRLKMHALGAARLWTYGQEFSLVQAAEAVGNYQWRSSVNKLSRNLVLFGLPGYGKTAIACAALNQLIECQKSVAFVTVHEYLSAYSNSFQSEQAGKHFEKIDTLLREVDYLVMDDANVNVTQSRRDILDSLVRWRLGDKKSTLITTNHDQESFGHPLNGWGERLGSVVATYHWLNVGGVQLRQTQVEKGERF